MEGKMKPKNDPIKWVGPHWAYKLAGVYGLYNLIQCGLRPEHKLLDFGCGSLRLGMYAMQYLDFGNYYGIEPHKELIDFSVSKNHLRQIESAKCPSYHFNSNCEMNQFDVLFDFIYAQSVFTHLSEDNCYRAIESAANVLMKPGCFLLTIREGKTRKVDEWTQDVVKKSRDWIFSIGENHGFVVKPRPDLKHWNNQQWYELRLK
jgi:cyclopropane fatty-acyl-phospholipid synthase-like methyltransferase